MKVEQLTNLQIDALKEICQTGAGSAATAISKMIGKKIDMSVPDLRFVPTKKVADVMGGSETIVVGLYCKIINELYGEFLLTFPIESAFVLSDVLLKRFAGETKVLEEMEKSALEEIGNIIAASFVNTLAKIINKNVLIGVPKFACDMAGAIIDLILIELAEAAEYAVVFEIMFHDVSENVKGKFFLLPDPKSLDILLSVVEKVTKDKGA